MSTQSTSCCLPWSGAPSHVTDLNNIDERDGNWQQVTLTKRDAAGKIIESGNTSRHFEYLMEAKTGDLYLYEQAGSIETKSAIAMKSCGIFMAALPYGALVMFANLVNMAMDIAKIAWRVLKDFGETWKNKGVFDALFSIVFAVVWEMPKSVLVNMWRIVRAPFYALGVQFAAALGIFSPYEGRRMIGMIEREWHDGLTFKDDFRMGKDERFLNAEDCEKYCGDCGTCFTQIKGGTVLFLGWCMQVRGNIHDKVCNVAKFALAS